MTSVRGRAWERGIGCGSLDCCPLRRVRQLREEAASHLRTCEAGGRLPDQNVPGIGLLPRWELLDHGHVAVVDP